MKPIKYLIVYYGRNGISNIDLTSLGEIQTLEDIRNVEEAIAKKYNSDCVFMSCRKLKP